MIPVSDAATVRARDTAIIDTLGIPGHTLMELAGRGAADRIHALLPPASAVAVFCGPGNNGGDGFVVARWLHTWGHRPRLWVPIAPRTPSSRHNAALCAALSIPSLPSPQAALSDAAAAVDALLGTGQRSGPRGAILDGVRSLSSTSLPTFALDIPTGLCADTGQRLGGPAVTAQETITFGDWKQGLLCEPAAGLSGRITRIDIGLSLAAGLPGVPSPGAALLCPADIPARLPPRGDDQAKWSRGHVAICAGGGAAVLAAHGAFRAGAGLVTVIAPRSDWPLLRGLWPEVIVAPPEALNPRRHNALVIGPGLGLERPEQVRSWWSSWPGALVADADALTILSPAPLPTSPSPRVITPHAAEAARLLGTTRAAVEADRFSAARALRPAGVCVLKGPHTIISSEAAADAVVPVRCGRLATAGSGDVLAGLIGGLLAQGCSPRDASIAGAWWHAQAGTRMPLRGTAQDLLAALPAAAPEKT